MNLPLVSAATDVAYGGNLRELKQKAVAAGNGASRRYRDSVANYKSAKLTQGIMNFTGMIGGVLTLGNITTWSEPLSLKEKLVVLGVYVLVVYPVSLGVGLGLGMIVRGLAIAENRMHQAIQEFDGKIYAKCDRTKKRETPEFIKELKEGFEDATVVFDRPLKPDIILKQGVYRHVDSDLLRKS